jgi:hypothetical protein
MPSGPTKRATDRPVAAIFRVLLLQAAVAFYHVALGGRRLTQAVGRLPSTPRAIHCGMVALVGYRLEP